MLPNAVNLPGGNDFSPDPCPSSSSSGIIEIFGVSIAPFNNKEEDDWLKERNLEINQKDCAETSHEGKAIEFRDYLSSMSSGESSRVEESNPDETSIDLELRLGSPIMKGRKIMVPEKNVTESSDHLSSENHTTTPSSRVEESNSDETSIDLELRLGSPIMKRRRVIVPKRNAAESSDYLSSENNARKSGASSRVEESNSDQTLLHLELGQDSIIMRRRIMGSEIVQQVEVHHEDPIIMGAEIIEQVQVVQHEDPIIMGAEMIEQVQEVQQEDSIIMGAEIIEDVEVQDEDQVIINAEIIQQVQFQPGDPNHWTIRKVLKKSDVDGSSRLLMGRNEVLSHIAPFFMDNPSEFCQNNEGIRVIVYDVDTSTGHMLKLTKWKTGSFVLKNNWMQHFVKRRKLMENDEVGLRWDAHEARLEFTVLRRQAPEG
ncbi:unnamed protein product [Fraxinus pennsylvanica]|uniref:B3 domain-containing protein n=1 Tax=Fraxinus pennsylvanica TaxID=56036 RepID=A0AAD2DQB9_9LAMI|nr:unnamed protein product [Fraxinus pennsylvanica]